jgi:predicted hotdog family 3-hydroxylacyl-ACP dehydratase
VNRQNNRRNAREVRTGVLIDERSLQRVRERLRTGKDTVAAVKRNSQDQGDAASARRQQDNQPADC